MRAVVFAYHNVGARCLRVLLAHEVAVPLVVTHGDDRSEVQWFERVSDVADDLGLKWIAPSEVNAPDVVATIRTLAPDFLFSFHYRRMLSRELLSLPSRGALNMHGSLLPRYRGRAPINWAVLNGERETGATLHYMTDKPDAGDIVTQQSVPILPDDTARQVSDKVTVAAEICLDRVLPSLIDGTAPRLPNDLRRGSYFSGRTPADGRIDWSQDARRIHDLVRAVAPPYPGALTQIEGVPARILRTRVLDASGRPRTPELRIRVDAQADAATVLHERIVAQCGGGGVLGIDELELDGRPQTPATLRARFGVGALTLR